jgi:hypothetical protein
VLKQYPTLRVEVGNAATESLDKMRDESKKATLQLIDMECGYLTVEYFRKLPEDIFVCRFCALVVSPLILVFHPVIMAIGGAQNRVRERDLFWRFSLCALFWRFKTEHGLFNS